VATTTGAIGLASTAAQIAGSLTAGSGAAAGAAGAAGGAGALSSFLGAAIPLLGIAAVAAPVVGNLISCGTISSIGCDKRSDSTTIQNIEASAVRLAYAVEMGQITPADAIAQLQQISSNAIGMFANPQRSWITAYPFKTLCGTWDNNGTTQSGPPCSDPAAMVIPNGTAVNGPQVIQDYINWIQARSSPVATIGADASQAISTITGSNGWLILAALGLGFYLLVK